MRSTLFSPVLLVKTKNGGHFTRFKGGGGGGDYLV